ncbi:MAG: hypothetical protein ACYC4K_07320 [Thiobacillus sp.]
MSTIIDSLLVELGLSNQDFIKKTAESEKAIDEFTKTTKRKTKELDADQKKAADAQEKRAKEAERQGKKNAEMLGKIRNEALGMLAVFTGGKGLIDFAENTIKSTVAIGNLSAVAGMSIQDIAAWQLALKDTGGTAEEMASQIAAAAQAVSDYKNNIPNATVASFLSMGGSTAELKNAETYMQGLARITRQQVALVGETRAAGILNNRLGISPAEFALLKQSSAELQKQLDLDRIRAGLNDADLEQAKKMLKAQNDISATLSKSAKTLLFDFSPVMLSVANLVQEAADGLHSLQTSPVIGQIVAETVQGWDDLKNNIQLTGMVPDDFGMSGGWGNASTGPRGVRNNNLGNIKDSAFARSHGSTGADSGGFAIFKSVTDGTRAEDALIKSYLERHFDTIKKFITRYAPSSENNTGAYIAAVSKQMGMGADSVLTGANIAALRNAIFTHENGAKFAGSTSTASTDIHQIVINTRATDANGIASGIGSALSGQNLALQANGL